MSDLELFEELGEQAPSDNEDNSEEEKLLNDGDTKNTSDDKISEEEKKNERSQEYTKTMIELKK